ncbi:MAG: extracellular solute-binding protein [Clostridiales bacterium]|nr:extracellular solute-binding protein [Clostridiales bacterium]
MGIFKRTVSLFLCLSLGVSLAACKKSSSTPKEPGIVNKDDPWFSSNRFALDLNKSDSAMLTQTDAVSLNGKIFHTYSAFDMTTFQNSTTLDVYDEQGARESSIPLSFPSGNGAPQGLMRLIPSDDDDSVVGLIQYLDPASNTNTTYFADIDTKTGTATLNDPITGKDGAVVTAPVTGTYLLGEYLIFNLTDFDTGAFRALVYQDQSFKCEIDFSSINGVSNARDYSYNSKTGHALVNVQAANNASYLCEVDLKDGKILNKEVRDNDKDEVDLTAYQYSAQGELLRLDSLGNIYKYDPETRQEVKVFENNWYSPYFSDFDPEKNYVAKVLSFTEDKVILYFYGGNGITTAKPILDDFTITVLSKEKNNPHAGKQVIEISAPLDMVFSDYMSQAIVAFNEQDAEYLIRIWNKYSEGIQTGSMHLGIDPEDAKAYTVIRELGGSDCPDLVLNMDNPEAINGDLLLDLSTLVEESTKQALFDNILETSQVNGKLFYIPVTLEVDGLVVKSSLLEKDRVGITFDEYDQFVENSLSGVQPYDYPYSAYNYRNEFFFSCVDIKSAIEGDTVNFDSEQFRQAAEYAKTHFSENAADPNDEIPYEDEILRPIVDARYVKMTSFIDYVLATTSESDAFSFIGTPSVDSRGPWFKSEESISVAKKTDRQEGCKKFINFLLSGSFITEDSQMFASICTNKEVLSREISLISDYYNSVYEQVTKSKNVDLSDLLIEGHKKIHPEMQESFLSMLSNLSVYYIEDKDIRNIICEELAPYYVGDHSIDDTIKFINDRVSKYINETK